MDRIGVSQGRDGWWALLNVISWNRRFIYVVPIPYPPPI
jgi:hypothetical protein